MKEPLPYIRDTLIRKIAEDDENAFRELFNLYYQKLFHTAFYFLKSREWSEEAVCDVFYTVWKKRKTLPDIKDINSYLYISIKNQALHYIRRAGFSGPDRQELYQIEYLPNQDSPEEDLLDNEYKELIQKAIFSLPGKCRETFRLYISDKLKQKEIARILDISEKTVEAHIANAYKRITQYVNKEYDVTNQKGKKLFSVFF